MPAEHRGADPAWIHATALVIGESGILLRGASGAGKSSFAALLLDDAAREGRFARLVGDDRVHVEAHHGRLVARAHPETPGQMERRGLGVVNVAFEPACVVRLVVDLAPADAAIARFPAASEEWTRLCGVTVPRLTLPCLPDRQASLLVRLKIATG